MSDETRRNPGSELVVGPAAHGAGGEAPPRVASGPTSPVLRGTRLDDPLDIDDLCEFVRRSDPLHVNIFSKAIPHKYAYGHILVLGTTDAGKTTVINQLLKDMLWHLGTGVGHRVFIWDYKRTARRYLESLPLTVPVYHLDPVDARSHGIDWAREIGSRPAAMQFVKDILHQQADPRGHNYAFIVNARSALYQVIRTFQMRAPGRWDLVDVVEACTSVKKLGRVLDQTERGRNMMETVFGTNNQGKGIFFSLEEFAFNLGPIAAALSKIPRERRITLADWRKSESVLVLGHHESFPDALAPFQRWVFGSLSRHLLSGPDIPHDGTERTAFFLDEVRNSPFGAHLVRLANSGRSKGASIVAGLGNIAGLRVAIGKDEAEEFLAMFKTKAFLRMDGEAAEWAEKYFGKQLRMIRKFSETDNLAASLGVGESWQRGWGHGSATSSYGTSSSRGVTQTGGTGYSYEPAERTVVYAGDFRSLTPPKVEPGSGLVARAYLAVQELAWFEVATHMEEQTIEEKKGTVHHEPRDDEDFDHDSAWGPEDYERLGLGEAEERTPEEAPDGTSPFQQAFGPKAKGRAATGEGGEGGVEDFPGWTAESTGVFFDKGELDDAKWDRI